MTRTTKKECIYIALAFFTAICGLPWIQMAYNDPAVVLDMAPRKLLTLMLISLCYVIAQTLIAWKAFLSDPTGHSINNQPSTKDQTK